MKKTDGTPKPKRQWYEYITPAVGIKWGAEVTLIFFTVLYHRDSLGLMVASGVTAGFLLLEWAAMAWREFKRD